MEEDLIETHDPALGVSRLLRKYAPTPFLIYRQRQLPGLQKEHPQAKVADLVKILQVQWKDEDVSSPERIECTVVSDMIRNQLRECLPHTASISTWVASRHNMKQSMSAINIRPPKFYRHLGRFGSSEAEQRINFSQAWRKFSPDHNIAHIPSFARQKINLFVLYRAVVSLGGFEHICERQLWDTIVTRQGLDSASTPTDKAAAMILQISYFTLLIGMELQYQFVQAEEEPSLPCPPQHPFLSLPIAPLTPSSFPSNYYRQPGMTAILFSLRSRMCSSVCWALNQLLLLSYNQNRPVLLSDSPALLEILVALMERQLLVIDMSQLGSRASLPNLSQYVTEDQTTNHNVVFPDLIPALLVILKNLAFTSSNQSRIAQHHSCAANLLEHVFKHDAAGDTLLFVAQDLDISKLNFTSLSRWLHWSLLDLTNLNGVMRALEFIGIIATKSANQNLLSVQMHIEVYQLVVALLCHTHDDVVLAALEALAKLTSIGGNAFSLRIVAHTDIIDRLIVGLLLRSPKGNINDVVMRRTASVILISLYSPYENRGRFQPFLGHMFRAISKCYEVGALLAPILRSTAQTGR